MMYACGYRGHSYSQCLLRYLRTLEFQQTYKAVNTSMTFAWKD